jgi:flagellar biosynthesis GTPase FlhF
MQSVVGLSGLILVTLSNIAPCIAAHELASRSSEQSLASQALPGESESLEVAGFPGDILRRVGDGLTILEQERRRQEQRAEREQREQERQAEREQREQERQRQLEAQERRQEELAAARRAATEEQRLEAERRRQHFENLSPSEREAYLAQQRAEQDAAARLLLLMFSVSGGGDASAAPPDGDSSAEAWRTQQEINERQRLPEPEPASQPNSGGFYGNCHGGSAYGC